MVSKYIFYAMKRSGHHAILFWIFNNLGGVEKDMGKLVFSNKNKTIYYFNDIKVMYELSKNKLKKVLHDKNVKYIFISAEDITLFRRYKLDHLREYKRIFVVRDFVNMYASRKKRDINENILREIALWKQFCNIGLNNKSTLMINYNKWISDKMYRNEISRELGIPNIKDDIEYVPDIGKGSSFTGVKKSRTKDYLERYKLVKFDKREKRIILSDKELLRLNFKFFDINIRKILRNI